MFIMFLMVVSDVSPKGFMDANQLETMRLQNMLKQLKSLRLFPMRSSLRGGIIRRDHFIRRANINLCFICGFDYLSSIGK